MRAPGSSAGNLVLAAMAAAAFAGALPARAADLFSPGELSRAHQSLEGGLQACTRCHVAGQQLSPERCLDCHTELKARVDRKAGFHGRLPATERQCESCHHEHQGRDEALVDWGKGGQKAFDHSRTGFELKGKHRNLDCARCHDPRRISDPVVTAVLQKSPGRKTFLGQPTACSACHFDEHRGQLGTDCQRCHSEEGWKPVRGFDHARTPFPLTGKHARLDCAKCHVPQTGPAPAVPATLTPPVHPWTPRWKGLAFQQCTDCHKDPHQDRFGASCTQCHDTEDWKQVGGQAAGKRAFHEQTRYPLRGAHAMVACQACHGQFPGQPARYRGLSFAHCTDCHMDAHLGQLATLAQAGDETASCERCHTVDGWVPPRFEAEDHDRTAFKLEGAHRTVACVQCHVKDQRLASRVPAVVKTTLESQRRPVRVSPVRFDRVKPADCAACHRDPHAGQFDRRVKAEGCTACHGMDTFRQVRFDHARDSSFPLLGKHAQTACASCHRADAAGVVRYAPLPFSCGACHADPHAGQFAAAGQPTDCSRCHGVQGWKDLGKFVHAPPFTGFRLTGKHQALSCERCHPAVAVAGSFVRKYKAVPTTCQGCHQDFHKGAFRGFVP